MKDINNSKNKSKSKKSKSKLKIKSIGDLKNALKLEGYSFHNLESDALKESIKKTFNIDSDMMERLYEILEEDKVTYTVNNVDNFFEYMDNICKFEKEYNEFKCKITEIEKLHISRVEYEREMSIQEEVSDLTDKIENIRNEISERMNREDISKIITLERELDKENIYTKDIELLKNMLIAGDNKYEVYNDETKIKTITIEVPKKVGLKYIKPTLGSIEYHHHIKSNIPRLKRLKRNMHKYLQAKDKDKNKDKEIKTYHINQSEILQDTINIAIAIFNDKEFKAISGSNDVLGYCVAPAKDKAEFISKKVNKLGQLGIGYNRVNDSEKKILEEINKQIKEGKLESNGDLILYSKWEPCPSCYYVMWQFSKKYPNINVKVKYHKKYGE